jgi:hypothetical protein
LLIKKYFKTDEDLLNTALDLTSHEYALNLGEHPLRAEGRGGGYTELMGDLYERSRKKPSRSSNKTPSGYTPTYTERVRLSEIPEQERERIFSTAPRRAEIWDYPNAMQGDYTRQVTINEDLLKLLKEAESGSVDPWVYKFKKGESVYDDKYGNVVHPENLAEIERHDFHHLVAPRKTKPEISLEDLALEKSREYALRDAYKGSNENLKRAFSRAYGERYDDTLRDIVDETLEGFREIE